MKRIFLFLLFLTGTSSLLAQGVTTGSMHGSVTAASGNLVGATVIAIHQPSGTKFGAIVRSNGQYNIRGMRVGGPYTVTASFIGFKTQSKENINVGLGQDIEINFSLKEEAATTEEVIVTAEKSDILNSSKTGSGSTITEDQIEAAPTINRSIGDIARVNPLATESNSSNSDGLAGISIGGQNTRFNNFQIDGAVANDMFGIGGSGTAGSQANSNFISLDAIQELQVSVSPYDVRQSGFTGGIINAITRGGTNTFTGSVFLFGRNQDFVGRSPDANRLKYADFSDFQFGGRIGGPIIENELFFHVTAERRQRRNPLDVALNDTNSLVNFPVDIREINEIISVAREEYGYDAGNAAPFTARNNSTNIIARLDWNISDLHRLQFRHNFTDAFQDRNVSRNNTNYSLTSQWNEFGSLNNSTVLQLNSLFSESISNEFRLSYTVTSDQRRLQAERFPEVRIYTSSGRERIELGPEANSQQNALDQDQIALTNDLTFFIGKHVLTVGTHNEIYRFNNLFIPNAFGYYEFRDVDAFRDSTPNFYRVSYANTAVTGGDLTPRAKWSMMQNGLYIQDDWNITDRFRLNLGLRADIPVYFDEPFKNELFSARFDTLAARYTALPDSLKNKRTAIPSGLSTSNLPDSKVLWAPRIGFNWDVSGDRTFQIRGGTGFFTGRVAAVWLSNQYSNTGVDLFRAEAGVSGSSSANPIVDPVTGLPVKFTLDPSNPPVPGDGSFPGSPVATSAINITDKNFTMPQVWRSTLGLDFEVVQGLTATVEGMYSKQYNQVDFENINLRRSTRWANSPVDGRPLYATNRQDSLNAKEFTQVIVLKSRSEGYQYSVLSQLVLSPNNTFLKGLSGTLAYTNAAAYDINAGTNSTANSLWTGTSVSDPNRTQIGRSNFDVTHRILANLSYRLDLLKDFPTTIGIYYSGNSGRPYSLTYGRGPGVNNDANGDGVTFNDLIYVPKREDFGTKIIMETDGSTDLRTPEEIWEQFMTFIDNNDALKDFRGKIVDRNSARAPWINQLDMRVAQSFPSFGNQSIEFTLDVQNLLNLLNPDWGIQKYMQFTNMGVIGFRDYDAQGRMRLTFADPEEFLVADTFYSRWRMQLGMRYNF
jgi:outer membrane receptor for ferrienterochelin and colicin